MRLLTLSAAAAAFAASAGTAQAERLVALIGTGQLTVFDSATPGSLGQLRTVSGLGGQGLVGIDVRPADGQLYGLGNGGGIFTISLADGNAVATLRSTLSGATLAGSAFDIDFNPVPDRLRVVSDADINLRVNVDTGVAIADGTLKYVDGNANTNPQIVAAGYTNSIQPSPRNGVGQPTGPGTQLFYIDSNLNQLVTTTAPNLGELTAVGPAGNPDPTTSLDISGATGIAYSYWFRSMAMTDGLFTLNLATGAPTLLGTIGSGRLGVRDVAVAPLLTPAPAVIALFGLGVAALIRRRA